MSNEVIDGQATTAVAISPEVQAMLDQAAKEQAEAEQSVIPFMSFKGKKFTIGEDNFGTVLDVVLLAGVYDHSWYDRPYDPKAENAQPPACFAIGEVDDELVPDETSPVIQHTDCASCPKNQFESGANGKGKACRNGRRFLVASVGEKGVNLSNLAIINIAPTSLRNMSKYIKSVNNIKSLPYWAVVTTLKFEEDPTYPVLAPSFKDVLAGPDLEEIARRLPEFKEAVSVPYDVSGYEAPDAAAASTAKKSKMS